MVAEAARQDVRLKNKAAQEAYEEEYEQKFEQAKFELEKFKALPKPGDKKRPHELKYEPLDRFIKGNDKWHLLHPDSQEEFIAQATMVFTEGATERTMTDYYQSRHGELESDRRLRWARLKSKMSPISQIATLEKTAASVAPYDRKTAAKYRKWADDIAKGRRLDKEGERLLENYAGTVQDQQEVQRLERQLDRWTRRYDRLNKDITALYGLRQEILRTPDKQKELQSLQKRRGDLVDAMDEANSTLDLLGRPRPQAATGPSDPINPDDPLSPYRGEPKSSFIIRVKGRNAKVQIEKYREEMGW